ncbi:hypothetical protein BN940_14146 [Castellaniella defragrans 65Phen]|uniref:Uncharacterized protein n=2 Tax=Castellaniella defragrans TaxID=75697 RepID=W8X084_CASD6|nr:hypothetical protein [Castellaniella defragrans]KAB0622729.1 hypothetical protein F7Q88_02585 [Castellaniella defragrans]MBB6085256.1 hypothetical protein [Castellaniella defragrans]CDM25274.1 hypothetical protein BN940_14146 [Castellaniella defragrans 65Phen]
MTPDVDQYLRSMCKAMSGIILPELEGKPFAREQAGLVLATLELLAEVQEHQFAYARQELADLRQLFDAWRRLRPDSGDATFWTALHESGCAAGEAGPRELRELIAHWKSCLRTLMEGWPPSPGSELRILLDRCIERQLARETAWLRRTGFIPGAADVPHVSTVLAHQARAPLDHCAVHSPSA